MKPYISCLMICSCLWGFSQNSLEGIITSGENNIPLHQVSVYFPQLERGAVTNETGSYLINNVPAGSYKLIASYLGYLTYSMTIVILPEKNTLNISLQASVIEMEEVIVSTPFHKLQRENVMKVEQVKMSKLKSNGAFSLSDGITDIAGVESVSTGLGIGKPVIRGLSANRVVVYAQGVRLENQQFGAEHGLGIGEAGIESIEVIKGPASLLYGSDALGGVLYLNPERFAISNTSDADIHFNYFTNTEGLSANAGAKFSGDNLKFLIRASTVSHLDYKTGGGDGVVNSRFKEYDLKSGLGFQLGIFRSELRYNYTQSSLGIPEDIGDPIKRRSPDLPFQDINNHILSAKTDLFFKNSSLKLTLGYIHNNRKEFEDTGDQETLPQAMPALDMSLSTFNYNLSYALPKKNKLETIIGVQGMGQTNKNFGEEVLIPNARTNDFGILTTSHIHLTKSDIQFGIRYDHRAITGSQHGMIGEPEFIAALDRSFNSFNVALGYRIDLSKEVIGRINLASGFRAPNLAELTSNGVHEGTNRYEIGNPNLLSEKSFQLDMAAEYKNEHIEIYINGFYNTINDYIFLEPNGEVIAGDDVYEYRQQSANLYGGEIGLHIHPHPLDWLHFESSFESVTGKLANDTYLPLIPANSLSNTIRVELNKPRSHLLQSQVYITLKSVFDQNNISAFESTTAGYNLLNLGFGTKLPLWSGELALNMSINNLLNTSYISHLSRLKTDNIQNIGRNILFGISFNL